MEAKIEFLRKGLTGPIYGLVDKNGQVVRQYSAKTEEEAFNFFLTQSESLKADDGISSIIYNGKIVNL